MKDWLPPLADVPMWGCPWHGLVEGSLLTLPDASTMAWTQPTGGDAIPIKAVGQPAIDRTPEQLAEDAAKGHQWLDHALLSGRTRQIYGQATATTQERWLYAPAPGVVFLCELKTASNSAEANASGGNATLVIGITPWRVDGDTPVEREVTVNMSGIGQPQWDSGAGLVDKTLYPYLASMSLSGSRAAIKLNSSVAVTCGWLLLTLDGLEQDSITVTGSVHASRAETFRFSFDYTLHYIGDTNRYYYDLAAISYDCNGDGTPDTAYYMTHMSAPRLVWPRSYDLDYRKGWLVDIYWDGETAKSVVYESRLIESRIISDQAGFDQGDYRVWSDFGVAKPCPSTEPYPTSYQYGSATATYENKLHLLIGEVSIMSFGVEQATDGAITWDNHLLINMTMPVAYYLNTTGIASDCLLRHFDGTTTANTIGPDWAFLQDTQANHETFMANWEAASAADAIDQAFHDWVYDGAINPVGTVHNHNLWVTFVPQGASDYFYQLASLKRVAYGAYVGCEWFYDQAPSPDTYWSYITAVGTPAGRHTFSEITLSVWANFIYLTGSYQPQTDEVAVRYDTPVCYV